VTTAPDYPLFAQRSNVSREGAIQKRGRPSRRTFFRKRESYLLTAQRKVQSKPGPGRKKGKRGHLARKVENQWWFRMKRLSGGSR